MHVIQRPHKAGERVIALGMFDGVHRGHRTLLLNAKRLADEMGVALQTIYRWENGEREPDIATFMKLMRTLGVDLGKAME